jgi:hypothetical protein
MNINFQTRYFPFCTHAHTQTHVTIQGVEKKETDERGEARLRGGQDKMESSSQLHYIAHINLIASL